MKIKIKAGTPVFQDQRFFEWPGRYVDKANTVFETERISAGRIRCVAFGFGVFGSKEAYGNGPVYMDGKL